MIKYEGNFYEGKKDGFGVYNKVKMTKMKYLINYTYKGQFKKDEIDFNGFAFEMFSVRY